jgi:hypothetical protein
VCRVINLLVFGCLKTTHTHTHTHTFLSFLEALTLLRVSCLGICSKSKLAHLLQERRGRKKIGAREGGASRIITMDFEQLCIMRVEESEASWRDSRQPDARVHSCTQLHGMVRAPAPQLLQAVQ